MKLVPAFDECVEPANATHGAPLALPSCSPPVQSSTYLTMNAPDRSSPYNTPANGNATLILKVTCLTPGTTTETGQSPPCGAAGDQIDVRITSTLNGIRCVGVSGGCAAAGGQYSGKVMGLMNLRMTDRLNGPAETSPGTLENYPFSGGFSAQAEPAAP